MADSKTTRLEVEFNNFPLLQGQLRRAIGDIAEEIAGEALEDVQDAMAGSGGGRVYGTHVASAPGDPPAIDMGDLEGSYQAERMKVNLAAVGSTSFKAAWLEYGLRATRMAARPVLKDAVKARSKEFEDKIGNIEDRLR